MSATKTRKKQQSWTQTDLGFDLGKHHLDVGVEFLGEVRILAHINLLLVKNLLDTFLNKNEKNRITVTCTSLNSKFYKTYLEYYSVQ